MQICKFFLKSFLKYHKNYVPLASPKVLTLEKTQKLFGFLLIYSYLCIRNQYQYHK